MASETVEHRTDPKSAQSRCRVDCSCGWRGPLSPTYGEAFQAWLVHHTAEMAAHGAVQ